MLSANNILSPSNGAPIAVPTQDMVLGIYYLTKERLGTPEHPVRGEGRLFADAEEVRIAYDNEDVDLQARIRLRWKGEIIETTVGRTLFNEIGAGAAAVREPGAEEEGGHRPRRPLHEPARQRGDRALPRRAEGPRLPLRDPVGAVDRHRRHAHPVVEGAADRQRAGRRSTRSRPSTRTASSPTASATTRSSTSGRTSPSRSPTRCSRSWRTASRAASSTPSS